MDEIMDAASDGNYRLNVGFQYPNQPSYTDAGKETYNIKNAALAKEYLQKAGYTGEPVILLTNQDYAPMYNSALVMQQQLQAVGINAQMKVVDWPTSVQMMQNTTEGWNFHFTGWGTQPALGALATNPFPDATPAFFRDLAAVVNRAVDGMVTIVLPFGGYSRTINCNAGDAPSACGSQWFWNPWTLIVTAVLIGAYLYVAYLMSAKAALAADRSPPGRPTCITAPMTTRRAWPASSRSPRPWWESPPVRDARCSWRCGTARRKACSDHGISWLTRPSRCVASARSSR